MSIIGIIAAITIVPLKTRIDNVKNVVKLKKVYSNVTQAIKNIANENNCVNDLACTELFSPTSSAANITSTITSQMKISKYCVPADRSCFPSKTIVSYDGSTTHMWSFGGTRYSFITNDGVTIHLAPYLNNCSQDMGDNQLDSKVCSYLYIFLNGPNKISKAGRDTFVFYITKDALLHPMGSTNEPTIPWTTRCADSSFISGYECTGRLVEKNWVMDY